MLCACAAALLAAGGAGRLADLLLHYLSFPPADAAAVTASLLSVKTMCNLCCGCLASPLRASAQRALVPLLEPEVPPGWAPGRAHTLRAGHRAATRVRPHASSHPH